MDNKVCRRGNPHFSHSVFFFSFFFPFVYVSFPTCCPCVVVSCYFVCLFCSMCWLWLVGHCMQRCCQAVPVSLVTRRHGFLAASLQEKTFKISAGPHRARCGCRGSVMELSVVLLCRWGPIEGHMKWSSEEEKGSVVMIMFSDIWTCCNYGRTVGPCTVMWDKSVGVRDCV